MKILTDKMEDLLYEYMEIYQDDRTPENGERLCTVLDAVMNLADESDDKHDKQKEQKPKGILDIYDTEKRADAFCKLMNAYGGPCHVEKNGDGRYIVVYGTEDSK